MEAVSAYCLLNPQLTGKKGVLIILTSVYVPPVKQTGLENREIHQIQDVHVQLGESLF